jgi:hypothetical protein
MYTALTVVVAAPVKETVLRFITCPTSNSGMGMFARIGLKFFVHDHMKRRTISKVRALVLHDMWVDGGKEGLRFTARSRRRLALAFLLQSPLLLAFTSTCTEMV